VFYFFFKENYMVKNSSTGATSKDSALAESNDPI
jgi:hypothetical protein